MCDSGVLKLPGWNVLSPWFLCQSVISAYFGG